MTPLKLTTLLAASVASVVLLLGVVVDHTLNVQWMAVDVRANVRALAVVCWVGFIATTCRDDQDRKRAAAEHRLAEEIGNLHQAVEDYGDRRANDGRLQGIRHAATQPPLGRRPHLVD